MGWLKPRVTIFQTCIFGAHFGEYHSFSATNSDGISSTVSP